MCHLYFWPHCSITWLVGCISSKNTSSINLRLAWALCFRLAIKKNTLISHRFSPATRPNLSFLSKVHIRPLCIDLGDDQRELHKRYSGKIFMYIKPRNAMYFVTQMFGIRVHKNLKVFIGRRSTGKIQMQKNSVWSSWKRRQSTAAKKWCCAFIVLKDAFECSNNERISALVILKETSEHSSKENFLRVWYPEIFVAVCCHWPCLSFAFARQRPCQCNVHGYVLVIATYTATS